jgi:hypothetical protein
MKVNDDVFSVEARQSAISDLEYLVALLANDTERPCPGCRFATPDGRTGHADTKFCSYSCPAAAQQMSSDPINHPIERGIVPLVYAFHTLRGIVPCWSCEGHLDGHGSITKAPRVWFYSTSNFYPKLITEAINHMEALKRISNNWMIRILPFSQSKYAITYCLEPMEIKTTGDGCKVLDSLRSDIVVIADNLRLDLVEQAQDYIDHSRSSPF